MADRPKPGSDSARRALQVLFAFSEQHPVRTVREVAEACQLPLPSAHRYVALLREEGLVAQGERGAYHLTVAVGRLGRAAQAATSLIDIADPVMRRLARDVGETVLLAQLVHSRPVCIHRVESGHRLRLSFEPGQELPPLSGASVKILVGMLTPDERASYVAAIVERLEHPHDTTQRFIAEVEDARRTGSAESSSEIDEGVWASAAPVTDGQRGVAALSLACPRARVDEKRRGELNARVQEAASELSTALGA